MTYTAEELIIIASNFEKIAKEKKKLDPKAEVRNRGNVCVPAEQAKDKKDHFPINNEAQARNALARVHQYSSVPEWYKGSLNGLQDLVSRKVHSKYPSIGKEKSSKKSSLMDTYLFEKYSQANISAKIDKAFDELDKVEPEPLPVPPKQIAQPQYVTPEPTAKEDQEKTAFQVAQKLMKKYSSQL